MIPSLNSKFAQLASDLAKVPYLPPSCVTLPSCVTPPSHWLPAHHTRGWPHAQQLALPANHVAERADLPALNLTSGQPHRLLGRRQLHDGEVCDEVIGDGRGAG